VPLEQPPGVYVVLFDEFSEFEHFERERSFELLVGKIERGGDFLNALAHGSLELSSSRSFCRVHDDLPQARGISARAAAAIVSKIGASSGNGIGRHHRLIVRMFADNLSGVNNHRQQADKRGRGRCGDSEAIRRLVEPLKAKAR
jgi:hypothetical protein